jgi:hypothetical protein
MTSRVGVFSRTLASTSTLRIPFLSSFIFKICLLYSCFFRDGKSVSYSSICGFGFFWKPSRHVLLSSLSRSKPNSKTEQASSAKAPSACFVSGWLLKEREHEGRYKFCYVTINSIFFQSEKRIYRARIVRASEMVGVFHQGQTRKK